MASWAAKRNLFLAVLLVAFTTVSLTPAWALPTPSKTAADQDLAQRDADLETVRGALENDTVRDALASHGLSPDEVDGRLAALSPDELHGLAQQVDQVQAAGVYVPTWAWIVIVVALVALIIAVA